ncbi:cellulose-binding protein II [Sphaerisporangium rufum]|uniref:Cellulose-binding protein II n=1 Tax=Sphaerisporangium rufum TaxID=1381558 RepID=A0A919RBP4_9ACTN|nr:cellulose binding domain-containing protein [Sphaerisporangium rufum]GII81037.1 cellulose-binding protein II [Sphaerisporangium rufum]
MRILRRTRTAAPPGEVSATRRRRGVLLAAFAAVLVAFPLAARAAAPVPFTGNATHFTALGSPYGGCGLPQSQLDTQNFVALNVYDTPGDYGFYPRPIPDSMSSKIGAWDNGRNCGRWVQVLISDFCTGTNDGAQSQPFCRGGSWTPDAYNGAELYMQVADSCGDTNAWCRDDRYHLDLSTDSLNKFAKNGVPVGDMYPSHWNNRHVNWTYVTAPGYTGDIKIGFMKGAQRYWPTIVVGHLRNGIHGVEYFADGAWQAAKMNSDMGQSFILAPTVSGGTDYRIRVRDAADTLINDGRVYDFRLPDGCAPCGADYTPVSYTTGTGPTATPTPTITPTPGGSPTPTITPTPGTSPTPAGSCSATYTRQSEWSGGFTGQIKVTNRGGALNGWTLTFTLPAGVTVAQGWNGTWTQSGTTVTVKNASWNGSVPAGGTIDLGFNGSSTGPSAAASGFALNGAACA